MIFDIVLVILAAVFLEDAIDRPKHVLNERRMFGALLQKPETEGFPSFSSPGRSFRTSCR